MQFSWNWDTSKINHHRNYVIMKKYIIAIVAFSLVIFNSVTVKSELLPKETNSPVLAPAPPPGPSNDDPCDAISLTVGATCTFSTYDNSGASDSGVASPGCASYSTSGGDVWFSVTVPASGEVVIDTDTGDITDGGMAAYSGSNCSSLTLIECDDDDSANGLMPSLTITGQTPGSTIWIRFWEYGGDVSGEFDICVKDIPTSPANDDCSGAIALTVNSDFSCGTVTSGTVEAATASADANGCSGTADDDVWYSFVATSTSHRVSLENIAGSATDMYHSIYSGSCGALTELNCNDGNSTDITGLTIGNTYYVRVYTYTSTAGQTSTFDVCVGTPPPPPANDECVNAISLTINPDYNCGTTTAGTVVGATASAEANACSGTADDDVWFSFVATNVSHTIDLLNVAGSTTDMYHSVYEGSCGALINVSCSDADQSYVTGLTPGNTYYVRIYTYTSTAFQTSTFDVCVGTPPPPPANDECVNAISLNVNNNSNCAQTTAGTIAEATPSAIANPCTGTADDDVWYSFVATSPYHQIELLNVSGTTTDLVHALYEGSCGSLSLINCSDPDVSAVNGLTVGNTYFIRIFSSTSTLPQTTTFDVCVNIPPVPPANDECDDAISLTVNPDLNCGTVTSGTVEDALASSETNPCGGTADDDVWYSFVATSYEHQVDILNAAGSTTDMYHAVYEGVCGSLVNLSCSDVNQSTVTGLTPGNTYYVRVYTWTSTTGQTSTFDICIGTPPPSNDLPCDAISLFVEPTCNYQTYYTDYATDSGEPDPGCANYQGGDVWFTVTVPPSGNLTVNTNDIDFTDSGMAIYSGTDCNNLTLIECDDDDSPNGSMSMISLTGQTPGDQLWIRIWEYGNNDSGQFDICVSNPDAYIAGCNGTFTDTGGTGADYATNEDYVVTYCPDMAGYRIEMDFTSFDVEDGYDYLEVYDGNSTSAPLVAAFDNGYPLSGIVMSTTTNSSGCLTFVFHSDGSGSHAGWEADINCAPPCQDIFIDLISTNPSVTMDGGWAYIDLCQGGTADFSVQGDYPINNTYYTQSDATSSFSWSFGDGQTGNGQTPSHTYTDAGGYDVNLTISDVNGCTNLDNLNVRVRVSPTPDFSGTVAAPDPVCETELVTLTGTATQPTTEVATGGSVAGTTFLPDGSGVTYSSGLFFDIFNPGQTVTSVNDIVDICGLIEHSYMGDLSMELECPNGQTMTIFNQGGSGTILGEPVATDLPVDGNTSDLTPGIGYSYCWSPTSTNGYIDDSGNWTNLSSYTDPIGNVTSTTINQLTPGTYEAEGAWTNLVGCPLNGTWTIYVTDHLSADNGYIFEWGINFDPSLYPALWSFTPTIVSESWSGPNMASTSNPGSANPATAGTADYVYSITDDMGCTYDTTITVTVNPGVPPTFNAVGPYCEGDAIPALPTTSTNGITGSWSPAIDNVNTTTYTFTPDAGQCATTTTLEITINVCCPVITCPPDINLSTCNDALPTGASTLAEFTALGGTYTNATSVSYSDATVNGCSTVTTRTYSVSNATCTVDCDQIITRVVDVVDPVLTGSPTTVTVEGCDVGSATVPAAETTVAGLEGLAGITSIDDNCTTDGNLTVSHSDATSGTCPLVITRTYEVEDECGNILAFNHIINVDDTTDPVLTGSPTTVTVEGCDAGSASVPAAETTVAGLEGLVGITSIDDNCTTDGNLSVSHSDATAGTCPLVITRTYEVEDECGNILAFNHIINVDDTTDPVLTGSPTTVIVEGCDAGSASVPAAETTVAGLEGLAGITSIDDNCTTDGNLTVSHSDATSGTCPLVITRTYEVEDECGNILAFNHIINVDDTTDPVLTGSPTTVTVEGCDAGSTSVPAAETTVAGLEGLAGITSIDDNCTTDGNLTVSHSDATSGTCPLVITRTYEVEDECGNILAFNHIINVDDTTDPVLTGSPTTVTVEGCDAGSASVPAAETTVAGLEGLVGITSIDDNCTTDGNLSVSHSDATAGTCPLVITRTYEVEDECGNILAFNHIINVDDTTDPVISAAIADQPASQMGSCVYEIPDITGLVFATDNCTAVASLIVTQSPVAGTVIAANTVVTITVADECGNTTTTTVNILVPASVTASTTAQVDQNCSTPGSATVEGADGTAPYTYAWPGTAGSVVGNTASSLVVGSYDVTVEDSNGCTVIETVTIIDVGAISASSSLNANPLCNGDTNGAIDVTIASGTSDFTIDWGLSSATTSLNNYTINGLGAGTYDITVTDVNGCQDVTSTTLTENAVVTASASLDANVTCNGGADGEATVIPGGGDGTYTYLWSNGATTASITGLTAGTYDVTVYDGNLCEVYSSVTISENPAVTASAILDANVTCNGGADGEATVTPGGGDGSYTYLWSNGATTATIIGLTAGTYDVTVYDGNLCEAYSSVTISENPAVTASTSLDANVTCNAGADGEATVIPGGGDGTYTYLWSNGAITATITGLTAGTYDVTVYDGNLCEAYSSVTISEPLALTVSTTAQVNQNCSTPGSATVEGADGTSPYTYAWPGTAGSVVGNTASSLVVGSYDVTVEDSNGCTVIETVTIIDVGAISASSSLNANPLCNGDTNGAIDVTIASGTSDFTIDWGLSSATTSLNNYTINGLGAGTYDITVTDVNGCQDVTSTTLTENAVVTASTSLDANVTCNGGADGEATVIPGGGDGSYTYLWSNGATTASITGLTTSTYDVTVYDGNLCEAYSSVTISENPAVTASTSLDANVTCNAGADGEATVTPGGGDGTYTYLWSNGATTATITGLTAGTYDVTVYDGNLCEAYSSVTISEPLALTASTTTQVNQNCSTPGSATVEGADGTAPYTYAWPGTAGGVVGNSASSLVVGSYDVTVTDDHGCQIIETVTIIDVGAISASSSLNANPLCNGDTNGAIDVTIASGTPDFTIDWGLSSVTTSLNNYTINGLGAGTYDITVTDVNGCQDVTTTTLIEPATLVISEVLASHVDVDCNGNANGELEVTATDGTAPYSYTLDGGVSQVSGLFTGLTAGTYTLEVTDAHGCTDNMTIDIIEPASLVISEVLASHVDVDCNGNANGELEVTATDGTAPYSYTLDGGVSQVSGLFTGLTAGTYTLEVTDAHGCTDNMTIDIIEPASLVISEVLASHVDVDCNGNANGELEVTATDGTAPYSYTLDGGVSQVSGLFTGLTAGTYTLEVTDAHSCTDNMTIDIIEPATLVISEVLASHVDVDCNGNANGELEVTATDGTAPYSYTLDGGVSQVSGLFTGLTAGTYTLEVTDAHGCTDNMTIDIIEPASLVISEVLASHVDVDCNGNANGELEVTATDGTAPYSYTLDGGVSQVSGLFTGLTAGTYTLEVTDAHSCTDNMTIDIIEPASLVISEVLASHVDVDCNGNANGELEVTATDGTAPYSYTLDGGVSQVSGLFTGLTAGTYTLEVTDAHGCTDNMTIDIIEPTALTASTTAQVDQNCSTPGSATVEGADGTSPYTYAWPGTASSVVGNTASSLVVGSYDVTVEDSNGCTVIETVTIIDVGTISASSVLNANPLCNGDTNGAIDVTVASGTPDFTIDWGLSSATTSLNNYTINSLGAGTYDITVTDVNGCQDVTSTTLTENAVVTASTSLDANVTCNGGTDGEATVIPGGGDGSYTYLWSNGATTANITGLTAGTYDVTVYDGNLCEAYSSVTISENPAVTASTTLDADATCNGDADGEATVIPGGGDGSYTYLWSNGATTASITGLTAGTYDVTVYDGNLCEAYSSVTISENPAVTASTTLDTNVTCNGGADGEATVTPGGGDGSYTYLWSNGATTATITGLTAGTYDVTVYDGNLCEAYSSVTISENPAVTASTSLDANVTCNAGADGEATVIPGGGDGSYTYLWSNGATTATITGLTAGTYDVTVYDGNLCEAYSSVTISENPAVTASTTLDADATCNGDADGEATVIPGGGDGSYTYLWSNGATTASITGLTAGTYDVTVYDGNLCEAYSSVTISENPAVTASTSLDADATCNGDADGEATVTPGGGDGSYTYLWSNGATTATITGLTAGTYDVTVYDGNLCEAYSSVTISEPLALTASTTAQVNQNCSTPGSATVEGADGTSPYTYAWPGTAGGVVGNTASSLVVGSYDVTVTDDHGCQVIETVTIIDVGAISASSSLNANPLCNGDTNGAIDVTVASGTPDFTIDWGLSSATTSLNNYTINGLGAGTYDITVTDVNGCQDVTSTTLTENAVVTASTSLDANVTCNGGADGEATVIPGGGDGTYTYLWSNGATTASITGLTAGTYDVTVYDGNLCEVYSSVTISENPAVTASTTLDTNVTCNGGADGEATVTPGGGDGSYTYLWSNGATTATITGLTAGTYDVTVYDGNLCEAYSSVTISENPAVTASTTLDADVTCNGGADGEATVTPGGGDGTYTYLWSNGITTATITGLTAGTYDVTVYDGNLCEAYSSVTISENPAVTASTTLDANVTCNGDADGEATVIPGGGDGSYTYLWSNGATTATITGLTAGTYDVTVYDGNLCEAYSSVTISENPAVTVSTTLDANVTCNAGADGEATVTPGGGDGAYTYLWSNGATTATIIGLTAGTYDVTVYDGNLCEAYSSVTISENPAVTASTSLDADATCNGDADGEAAVTPGGGDGTYTYLWSNGATTATITGLTAGTYDVTVYDGNLCEAYSSVTISENPAVTASTTLDADVTCNGGADGEATVISGGGDGSYTYLWSNGATTANITGLTAGTYDVTVYDGNLCEAYSSVTISENPAVTASTSLDANATCNGDADGEATVIPGGGDGTYTYLWSNGAITATITGLTAGTYDVTVYDGNLCEAYSSVTINENPAVTASAILDADVTCNGGADGSATVIPGGGDGSYTYLWSNGATTANITGLTAGTYDVTVYDGNLCEAYSSVTISEYPVVTVSIPTSIDVTCNGDCDGSATALGNGGDGTYIYDWSNGQTTASISGLCAGTYSVTVYDGNSCSAETSVTINENPTVTASISAFNDATINGVCDGDATVLAGGGDGTYTYLWSDAQTNATATGLCAGSYTVTVYDGNGCSATANVVIDEPAALSLTIVGTDVTCNGDCDGTSTVTPTGGVGPYYYTWSDAQTTQTAVNLCAGTYQVTVEDTNGAQETANITINENPAVSINVVSTVDVTCNGDCDGEATISPSGGTGSFSQIWDDGQAGLTAINLCAGNHSVTVTDTNGCTAETTVTINENPVVTATIASSIDVTCNGGFDGSASVTPGGGDGSYSYLWSDGQTTSTASNLSAGTYFVTVYDGNMCEATTSITINENPVVTASINTSVDVTCNGGSDGSATVTPGGGDGLYTYLWSNGQTSATAINLSAGSYDVTVYDGNMCEAYASVTISENPPVTASASVDAHVTCNGGSDGSATVIPGGGDGLYTYLWNNGQTTVTTVNLSVGTYDVTVYDGNLCEAYSSVTITENPVVTASINTSVDVTCNGGSDGSATVTPGGGTGSYTYLWSNGQTSATAISLPAGSYDVTVYDSNMCEAYASVTINENPVVTANIASSTDVTCFGGSDGSATVTPGGGDGSYTYAWSNSQNTVTATNLNAGTYFVTVYDGNMCEAITSVTISQNPVVTADITSVTDVTCNGGSDGSATVTAGGGTETYTYAWSNTQTSATATNLSAGTYYVTVYDGNMCEAITSVVISENPAVSASISNSTDVLCFGDCNGTATVGASGGDNNLSIIWSDAMSQTTNTATGLCPGSYNVTVTDGLGCTDIASVTIGEPTQLTLTVVEVESVSCSGYGDGSITVTCSGGTGSPYSYSWVGASSTLPVLPSVGGGTYIVTAEDQNGCEVSETITVYEPEPLNIIENVTHVQCGMSPGVCNVSVSGGNGGYIFSWDGHPSVTGSTLSGLGQGQYTVNVSDLEGCTDQTTMMVNTMGTLAVTITEDVPITCFGESNAVLSANCPSGAAPLDYYWNNGEVDFRIENLNSGIYNVQVSDNWGCSGQSTHHVIEPNPIVPTFAVSNVLCHGGNTGYINVNTNGGTEPYNYVWDGVGSGNTVSDLSSGWYNVYIEDAHNCAITDSVFVGQPEMPLNFILNKQNISCYGENDGRIAALAYGGTAPYTYEWNADGNISTDTVIMNLPEGFYSLYITDINGCATDTMVIIQEPAPIMVDYMSTNPSCIGNNDGYIELEVVGGVEPYVYQWDMATASLPYFDGLYEGSYQVNVVDANGCEYNVKTITLMDVPEECLRIPDAFTPNGDDNNDTWIIENLDLFNKYYVQVFNRWGQVLYIGEPGSEPWDGTTTEGKPVPTGSYIYVINLHNGSTPKTGVVTVVY